MLKGIELIDCAKANAKDGAEAAANRCGYGDNIGLFMENLNQACQEIGVDINELSDLITDQHIAKQTRGGVEIAPDTTTKL